MDIRKKLEEMATPYKHHMLNYEVLAIPISEIGKIEKLVNQEAKRLWNKEVFADVKKNGKPTEEKEKSSD